MVTFEDANGVRFDTIVLHDAEDVIHADALSVINQERRRYEMVQVPVLPLPTPPGDFTHGIYCDEFAEFQLIDMHARQYSGSFVPSNGVGTGFSRDTLEHLAAQRDAEIFDQSSLTEDYDIGVQIHFAGLRQLFFGWSAVLEGSLQLVSISRVRSTLLSGNARAGSPESRCNHGKGTDGEDRCGRVIGFGGIAKA